MFARGFKAFGLATFAFCLGVISGLILPIYFVAVIEAFLIIIIGYFCLFC